MTEIYIDEKFCKGCDRCGLCLYVCPKNVFEVTEHLNMKGVRPPLVARLEDCTGCENCMIYCPDMALVVVREGRRSA